MKANRVVRDSSVEIWLVDEKQVVPDEEEREVRKIRLVTV